MEKEYTLSVFTENRIGMLNRICIIFTRRHINLESITASESEVKNVFRYTIVVKTTKEQILKVIGQIEKLIEVLKAFVHEESEIVHQEIALYKIKATEIKNADLELVIRNNYARILTIDPAFFVIEKTGHPMETDKLFEELKSFGILEFVRSGRVAVTKPMKELSMYINEMNQNK